MIADTIVGAAEVMGLYTSTLKTKVMALILTVRMQSDDILTNIRASVIEIVSK